MAAVIQHTLSREGKGDGSLDPERDLDAHRNSKDHANDSDANSTEFQEGVQRVRAVTTLWTKKTLVLMFIL